eukprot:94900-Rhodomonas_salina.1
MQTPSRVTWRFLPEPGHDCTNSSQSCTKKRPGTMACHNLKWGRRCGMQPQHGVRPGPYIPILLLF